MVVADALHLSVQDLSQVDMYSTVAHGHRVFCSFEVMLSAEHWWCLPSEASLEVKMRANYGRQRYQGFCSFEVEVLTAEHRSSS